LPGNSFLPAAGQDGTLAQWRARPASGPVPHQSRAHVIWLASGPTEEHSRPQKRLWPRPILTTWPHRPASLLPRRN